MAAVGMGMAKEGKLKDQEYICPYKVGEPHTEEREHLGGLQLRFLNILDYWK